MASMPEPTLDPWNRPFWAACEDGRLIVQRCKSTGQTWFPPTPVSPFDPSGEWEWTECSGQGEVLSWAVFHQKYFAGFADRIPYNCAIVQLAEGARLVTNIDAANDSIRIGQKVSVKFERRGNFNVPIFGPVE